jgi:hypothetical protein
MGIGKDGDEMRGVAFRYHVEGNGRKVAERYGGEYNCLSSLHTQYLLNSRALLCIELRVI